jgi:hypothetical protein
MVQELTAHQQTQEHTITAQDALIQGTGEEPWDHQALLSIFDTPQSRAGRDNTESETRP